MGLFNIFKKAKTIKDDFFGTLTFIEIKNNPSESYFEGRGPFAPVEKEIEYLIDAEPTGPSLQQREFFKKVETNYKHLVNKAKPLIEQEFRNWEKNFKIKDFEKEFELVTISLPKLDNEDLIWDLSYETIHDENHTITVGFKNFDIDNILVDG